jgi:hypothetical protein
MSNKPNSTRAQTLFLRAFQQNPAGPPSQDWPAPAVLRRWLKNDDFSETLAGIRDAFRFQTDFHIASAAASAARTLQAAVAPIAAAAAPAVPSNDPAADLDKHLRSLTGLLRLAHLRQRFSTQPAPAIAVEDNGEDDSVRTNSKGINPKTGLPPMKWNPNWTDEPHVIANIFCDPDPNRLKAYMLLLTMRGRKGFEKFLAAFPDELEKAQQNALKHYPVPNQVPT